MPLKSIRQTFFFYAIICGWGAIACLGALWLFADMYIYNSHLEEMRQSRMEMQKELITAETEQVIRYLNEMKGISRKQLKTKIRDNALNAYSTAAGIYTAWSNVLPLESIKQLIISALRDIRFDHGRGYIFICEAGGRVVLHPLSPELEGRDVSTLQDEEGRLLLLKMESQPASQQGAFFSYQWPKPGAARPTWKMAYVHSFTPLNWYIGTSEFEEDTEQDMQLEALHYLESFHFHDKGYLVVGRWDGLSLLGAAKGKNLLNAEDVHGVAFVKEFIKAARRGGGFIEYELPSQPDSAPESSLCYVSGVEGWEWYVGAGIRTNTFHQELKLMADEFRSRTVRHTILLFIILVALGVLTYVFAQRMSHKMAISLDEFNHFFQEAAEGDARIDTDNVLYKELVPLTTAATSMIKARVDAQNSLKTKEALFRGIFENMIDGYFQTDPDGNATLISPSVLTILGYSTDEQVLGNNLFKLIISKPADHVQMLSLLNEEQFSQGFVCNVSKADGDVIKAEIHARKMPSQENPGGFEGVIRDVTARTHAEEKLKESERYYRSLFQNTTAAMFIFNNAGVIISCNSRFEAICEYSAFEIENLMPWLSFIDLKDRARVLSLLPPSAPGRSAAAVEFNCRFVSKSGKKRTVHVRMDTIPETTNRIASVLDISELKKTEEALFTLNQQLEKKVAERTQELEHKALALEAANDKLQRFDQLKSQLLSSVSRQLRTPLTSIMGFAKLTCKAIQKNSELLQENQTQLPLEYTKIVKNLSIIGVEGERLTRLINDFTDLDSLESGRAQWNDSKVDVRDAILSAINSATPMLKQHSGVRISTSIAPALPLIWIDRGKLLQVLGNILDNAIKFTARGNINIQAAVTDSALEISITDTGRGIAPKQLDVIFNKFHILNPSDTLDEAPKGTGLGLAICKEILNHYHGDIKARSELGRGSEFTLTIPLSKT